MMYFMISLKLSSTIPFSGSLSLRGHFRCTISYYLVRDTHLDTISGMTLYKVFPFLDSSEKKSLASPEILSTESTIQKAMSLI